jgi:hypothetical protein
MYRDEVLRDNPVTRERKREALLRKEGKININQQH